MPYLISIIIILTILVNGSKLIFKPKTNISENNKRQTYTINRLCLSTLTEKYSEDDFWNENIITFNGFKYKVKDINGGREFIPQDKEVPELIITPVEKDNCLTKYSKKIEEQAKQNQKQNNVGNSTNNQLNIQSNNLVKCQFPHSGEKIMTVIECNNSIDCQINGGWQIYPNKEKCKETQINYLTNKLNQIKNNTKDFNYGISSNTSSNYQIPTLVPLPTYQFPTYAPHPTYDFSYLSDEINSIKLPTLPPQKNDNCQEIRNTGLYDCEANSLRPLQ